MTIADTLPKAYSVSYLLVLHRTSRPSRVNGAESAPIPGFKASSMVKPSAQANGRTGRGKTMRHTARSVVQIGLTACKISGMTVRKEIRAWEPLHVMPMLAVRSAWVGTGRNDN